MPRVRPIQDGELFTEGGFWKLSWPEHAASLHGLAGRQPSKQIWIGPARGPHRLTKAQAHQLAWVNILSRTDVTASQPESPLTLFDFVRSKFVPEHVATKHQAGRIHYQAILKHVLSPNAVDQAFNVDAEMSKTKLKAVPGWPYLTDARLPDVKPEDVQRLVSAALAHGYSTQTATHIRNVVKAIYAHAKRERFFSGDNPAEMVRLPEMTRKETHALTLAQSKEVLAALRHPEREMALLAILTSLNVAEICGLQWKHVNLTQDWLVADGEAIPPRTLAVRAQWSLNELGSLRNPRRHRDIPIVEALLSILDGLRRRPRHTAPDDFVFVSPQGAPIDAHRMVARRLRPIGAALKIPRLTWRVFSRTHKSLAYELGMQEIAHASVDVGRPLPADQRSGGSRF